MRPVTKVDGVIVRRAVRAVGVTAVNLTERAARDGDRVVVAVLLLSRRITRSRRMTAVHCVIVSMDGNRVVVRCIARLGNAAIHHCSIDKGLRYTREAITRVRDRFLVHRNADVDLTLPICTQAGFYRTVGVGAAKVDAGSVLQQGNVVSAAAHRQRVPVDLGLVHAVA